ncbi:MAG: Smr/MutS family protein [Gemmatimonadota bacterium]|nr:MAG: Smr/MutS family protein [Gemmatimonadota bacterium]
MARKPIASCGRSWGGEQALSDHALSVLEFHRALEGVAGRATSPEGRRAVLALRPGYEPEAVRAELTRVSEMGVLLDRLAPWAAPAISECTPVLDRLSVDGAVLEASEVHTLGVLLASGEQVRDAVAAKGEGLSALAPLKSRLYTNEALVSRIQRSVDATGEVLDTASGDLRTIREGIRRGHLKIVKRLEAFIADLPERHVVSDGSVSIRDGRYVIPVRREGKGEVGGIIHDESATGATIFVEPPVAMALTNELKQLERRQAREVLRILREITGDLHHVREELTDSHAALVDFDSLYARARTAADWRGEPPELTETGTAFSIIHGRHPLLVASGEEVVPFDLALEAHESAVVVSGPNTGGKSVFLKAVGLISALTQSGVVPPVGKGTRLPLFSGFFADIGDEQSIAHNLSTFSAHLTNLKEIVENADSGSLVLIDEMGTGTDPTEGAALARAILEELVSRGATTLVTSHLGALKQLDREGSGIVNASLQFDPDRMEPTYQLVKGRPGRSYGLAIARRLGFRSSVLDRADAHLPVDEANVEDLLERLERQDREARELVDSLTREREEAARLRTELAAREAELQREERSSERRARDDARRILLEARADVEEAIEAVRQATDSAQLDEASREARRRVEEAARRQKELQPREPVRAGPGGLALGDHVKVLGSGATGTVVELSRDRALVEVSGLRLHVAVSELETTESDTGGSEDFAHVRSARRAHDMEPCTEVDLRGLRVDEVEIRLGPALDGAIVGDLAELRIIHGKGTGAVRAKVTELLGQDGRVLDFRLGGHGEGGAGVTVARLR